MLWLARSVGFDAVGGSVLTVHGILGCSLYHPRGLEAQTEIGKSSYDILPSSPLAFHSIIVADSILHTLYFSSLQLYTFRPFLCNSTTEYYTLLRTRFERLNEVLELQAYVVQPGKLEAVLTVKRRFKYWTGTLGRSIGRMEHEWI